MVFLWFYRVSKRKCVSTLAIWNPKIVPKPCFPATFAKMGCSDASLKKLVEKCLQWLKLITLPFRKRMSRNHTWKSSSHFFNATVSGRIFFGDMLLYEWLLPAYFSGHAFTKHPTQTATEVAYCLLASTLIWSILPCIWEHNENK